MDGTWWKKLVVVLGVLVAVALPVGASAQSVTYAKVDGIKGDVTSAQFLEQHVVESFGFSEVSPATAPRTLQPVKLRLQTSAAAVDFLRAYETNTVIASVMISFVRPNSAGTPTVFQDVLFKNVRIVSYRMAWAQGASRPSMDLEIIYQSARWTGRPQNANGSLGTPTIYEADASGFAR